jgi:uncharacterized Zn finger protein
MSLTLKNFDQVEDHEINERGLQYYKDGAISYLEEVDTGEWDASVMGTQLYSVGVNLKKLKINAAGCDCLAFAQNDYCKHVAAVLFAIRDRLAKAESAPKSVKGKKSKTKTSSQLLHDALHRVEASDLKKFIESYASDHKDFTNDVLLYFKLQSVIDDTSQEGFIEVVKTAVDSSRKKNEIDSDLLARYLQPILMQAQKYVNDSNYLEAFYVIKAIIEVISPLLKSLNYIFKVDTNAVTESIDLIEKISGFNIPPMFRDELFDYCIALAERQDLIDTDYDRRIDPLLVRLANDPKRKEQILDLIDRKLDQLIPSGSRHTTTSKLNKHFIYIQYKIELLRELHREKNIEKLIKDNIYYHDELAHTAIRLLIKNKEVAYAKQIIEDKLDGNSVILDVYLNKEREALKWQPYFLDIAILEKDLPNILLYAEKFFKSFQDIRYYDILKQYTPADKWHKKFEEIESSLFRKHYSFGILATIYIRESKLKDLFELLKKHAFLGNIHDIIPFLLPAYRSEVLALYNKAIISLLGHGTASAYKEAVDHLNYLLDLGQKETVHDWIETFKSIYSNRPRFLKELAKVKI